MILLFYSIFPEHSFKERGMESGLLFVINSIEIIPIFDNFHVDLFVAIRYAIMQIHVFKFFT